MGKVAYDLQLLLLPLLVGLILAVAGNPSDAVRLAFLSAAGIWLIDYAVRKQQVWLLAVAALWWLLFLVDSSLRSVSWFWFNSDIDAYFILSSVANTNRLEVMEFIQSHVFELLIASVLLVTVWFSVFFVFAQQLHLGVRRSQYPILRAVFWGVALLTVTAYLLRPARVLHPVVFWQDYHAKIQAFRQEINQLQQIHQHWDQSARAALPSHSLQTKQTHVLAITESLTSQNFGVCGYPRATTPHLQSHLKQLQVFCQAYSPEPSTIAALKLKLTTLSSSGQDYMRSANMLVYAKASGYKVFWISNQSDAYISSLFGNYADHAVYVNQRSGRSSSSLDENVLPEYIKALADPHPRKLLTLHLIGAHPNYTNRYPARFDQFSLQDQVQRQMNQQHYSFWIRNKRNQYDNALLYQDWVWKQLFDTLLKHQDLGFRSLVWVSDHGNEVGHELNYAGHSATTREGYHVPLVMWHDGLQQVGLNQRVVSTAGLDDQMLKLMQIKTPKILKTCSWLDANYRFVASKNWPYWQRSRQY